VDGKSKRQKTHQLTLDDFLPQEAVWFEELWAWAAVEVHGGAQRGYA